MGNKCFIVLGMHRSATSLHAKGLREAGVNMGKRLIGAHESNPYGHYENLDFVGLNDKLLGAAGGSWLHPPSREAIMKVDQYDEEIKKVIDNNKDTLWGWKDPRTVLTIDKYIPFLDSRPHVMCCFRDPREVAESLYVREKIPHEKGISLANEYNNRILDFMSNRYFL